MDEKGLCKQLADLFHQAADMITEANEAERKELIGAIKAEPKMQEFIAKYKKESATETGTDKAKTEGIP